VALLGVLSIVVATVFALTVGSAFGAAAPPAPTVTSGPADPTNQTSANFTFTDSNASATFLCSLDGATFTACTSPKSYAGPLAAGDHNFKVQAKVGTGTSSATEYRWKIDLTPPAAPSITAKPTNPSNNTSPVFSFTGEAGATFLCKLDSGSFVACSSPQTYAGPLSAGSHTFSVEAKDAAGNIGSSTSYTWTIDLTPPPPPAITSGPAALTTSTSASFSFNDAEPGVTFVCQLDIGVFTSCSSPKAYSGLADGSHTFYVKAMDAATNASSATSYTWTVDTTPPPAPSITSSPANPTNQTSASFSFTDADATATFLCSLDNAAFAACTSPKPYAGPLAAGNHTFKVEAKDPIGNIGAYTSYTWTIDLTPPAAPSITVKPTNPSNDDSPTFSFTGEAGASFLCKLDGGSFVACSSPQTYAGPLAEGSHTFSVEAKDAAGNIGATTSYTWTIDLTPPPTPTINSTPANPIDSHDATFTFSDVQAGVTFVCQLDAGTYSPCSTPKNYSGLDDGSHTFAVKAVDAAGNLSSPASYTWTVDTTPPPKPTITVEPPNPSFSTTATFEFTDPEPGVDFECKLDHGPWLPCSTPKTYTGLPRGDREFKVRAVDAAGNHGGDDTYKWKIKASDGLAFTISGDAISTIYPGGDASPIDLVFQNPNTSPITVTSATVTVTGTSLGASCGAGHFSITQQLSTSPVIPGSSTRSLSQLGVPQSQWPKLAMSDSGNQNGCRNATVNLAYAGTATG
jgi:hypothetical protein